MSVTINQANYGSAVYGTAKFGLFFVTINTGVGATGAIQAPSINVTKSLNSVSATGSVGTFTISNTVGLASVSATGAIGSTTESGTASETLTGVGATGAIMTVKLMEELERSDSHLGLVTMCVGGGQGVATVFERLN